MKSLQVWHLCFFVCACILPHGAYLKGFSDGRAAAGVEDVSRHRHHHQGKNYDIRNGVEGDDAVEGQEGDTAQRYRYWYQSSAATAATRWWWPVERGLGFTSPAAKEKNDSKGSGGGGGVTSSDATSNPSPSPSPPPPAPPPPAGVMCPITARPMNDPVTSPSGNTYDRRAITAWLKGYGREPLTGLPCRETDLRSNPALRSVIVWMREQGVIITDEDEDEK